MTSSSTSTPPIPPDEWPSYVHAVPESVLASRSRSEVDFALRGQPVPIAANLLTEEQRTRATKTLVRLRDDGRVRAELERLGRLRDAISATWPPDRDPLQDKSVRFRTYVEADAATKRLALPDVDVEDVANYLNMLTLFPQAASHDEFLLQVTQANTRARGWANLSRFQIPFIMEPGCVLIDVTRATEKDAAVLWDQIRKVQADLGIHRDTGGRPENVPAADG